MVAVDSATPQVNILSGSLLQIEQDEEPVIMRDEDQFSDEGPTDDEWKDHHKSEQPIGSMLTAKSACLLRLAQLPWTILRQWQRNK